MARKRGGLAGVWDRNKGVIKTLAPIALGAIPGVGMPLAALAGAAMGGFDRPGKGGIGFDVGKGIKGGVAGYGQGMVGAGARGLLTGAKGLAGAQQAIKQYNQPLSNLLTGGAQPSGATSALGETPMGTYGGGMPTGAAGAITPAATPGQTVGTMNAATNWRSALKNPQVLAGAFQAGASLLPGPETGIAQQQADIAQQRLDLERQQLEDEKKRRERIAQFLIPYAQQQFPNYFARS